MTQVMFVGGPRHGKSVQADVTEERERYRVPARSPKDEPVEYLSTKLILTFPNPLTNQPDGETWHTWVYVLPDLYPDNDNAIQALQQAVGDAAMRHYVYANGKTTTGGVEAVKVADTPKFMAWCEECPDVPEQEFVDLKTRATWMREHNNATGHVAAWENRKG